MGMMAETIAAYTGGFTVQIGWLDLRVDSNVYVIWTHVYVYVIWLGGLLVGRRTSVSQIRGSIPGQVAAV